MRLSELINHYSGGYQDDPDTLSAIAEEKNDEAKLRLLLRHGPKTEPYDEQKALCDRNLETRLLNRQFASDLRTFLDLLIRILEETPSQLENPDPDSNHDWALLVENVCRVLEAIGLDARPAVPALIHVMHANQRGLGELAASALGKIGGEEAILELNEMWYAGWDRKCSESCHGAWIDLHKDAFPVLLDVIENEQGLKRARALHSLEAADYPRYELIPLAMRLFLGDDHPQVREVAASLLQQRESALDACPYIHYLQRIAQDQSRSAEDRQLAAKTIDRIKAHLDRQPMRRSFGTLGCWEHEFGRYQYIWFFRWMDLQLEDETREGVFEFRPNDSSFHDFISLEIRAAKSGLISNVRLQLDYAFLYGETSAFAADIARSFLTTVLLRSEEFAMRGFLELLEKLMLGEQVGPVSNALFNTYNDPEQESVKQLFPGGSLTLIHGGETGSAPKLTLSVMHQPSHFLIEGFDD